jgi:hypothetical protein
MKYQIQMWAMPLLAGVPRVAAGSSVIVRGIAGAQL